MILECITFSLSKIDWTAISAIASAVMIIITGISIICTNNQNRKNRDSQIKTIKYQTRLGWLDNVKLAIVNLSDILRFDIVNSFSYADGGNNSNNKIVVEAFSKINTAKSTLFAFLYGHNSPEEKRFIESIDYFCKKYLNLLFDLEFFFTLKFDISSEETKDNVEFFRLNKKGDSSDTNRIWYIIQANKYRTDSKSMSHYLNVLIKQYHFEEFEKSYLDFIKYEETLAENILDDKK